MSANPLEWRAGYFRTVENGPVLRLRRGGVEVNAGIGGVGMSADGIMVDPAAVVVALRAAERVALALWAADPRASAFGVIREALGTQWGRVDSPAFGAPW